MRRLGLGFGVFLVVFVNLSVFGQGQAESPSVIGVVSVKGNDPTTFLALTDDQGNDWKLTGPKAAELEKTYQNRRVKVSVHSIPDRLSPFVPPALDVLAYEVQP